MTQKEIEVKNGQIEIILWTIAGQNQSVWVRGKNADSDLSWWDSQQLTASKETNYHLQQNQQMGPDPKALGLYILTNLLREDSNSAEL